MARNIATRNLAQRPSWRSSAWLPRLSGAAVLCTLLVWTYAPRFDAPLIFDDSATLVENASIRQMWPLLNGGPLDPPPANPVHARPLVNLTFAVNYHFGGLDPTGYRATNLALHFLTALVLWQLVASTLRLDYFAGRFASHASALGFVTALLWALHPLAIESVVYVTQRTELLMGLCYLGTLALSACYWNAMSPGARRAWLAAVVVVCAAGMLSKEMMASAPAMVLLYERTFLAGSFRAALRRSWPMYVGLAATWIQLGVLMLTGPVTPASGFGLGVPAHVWWLTQTKVIFLYLKLVVWPWPLVIHYQIPYLTSLAAAWPWLLATLLLAGAAIVLTWKRTSLGFVLAWFFAVLSPTLVIPLVNEIAAERRMYVPLAALAAAAVIGLFSLLRVLTARSAQSQAKRLRTKQIAFTCGILLVAFVAAVYLRVDHARLAAFASERALWADAANYQPDDPLVRVNLGIALVQDGESQQAIEQLTKAIRLNPKSYRAHYNLGRALEAEARPAEALEHYQAALTLNPQHAASHNNLGRLLDGTERPLAALEHYREALRIDPQLTEAHNNLGILLLQQGFTHQAINHFEQARALRPDLAAHANLAGAYARAGRRSDAERAARQAIELAHAEGNEELAAALSAALLDMQRTDSER